MTQRTINLAAPGDADAIAAIYAPYVLESIASFEYDPPDAGEIARRMAGAQGLFPWLVCRQGETLIGYAYAGRMGMRRGYDWSAALSVYINKESRQTGAGSRLYKALEALLTLQGYRTAYGMVAIPNPASEAFHRRMGYQQYGLLPQVGYKFGRVAGVAYYGKTLLPVIEDPPLPRAFSALPAGEAQRIMQQAAQD